MSQNFYEIAKEITLAAIEKGAIIQPAKANMLTPDISKYNQLRAKEIGNFYKTIAAAVNETMQGKFNVDE